MYINKKLVETFPQVPVIYRIYNIESNKGYIGKCEKGLSRVLDHVRCYKRPKCEYRARLLYRAINKHGIEKFNWEILHFPSSEEIDFYEKSLIEKYESCNSSMGYNITEGGTGGYTTKNFTEEQKILRIFRYKETRKKTLEKDPNAYDWSKRIHAKTLKDTRACPIKSAKNRQMSRERLLRLNKTDPRFIASRCKKCIHIESGRIFDSLKEMSAFYNIRIYTLRKYIKSNKTTDKGTFKLYGEGY